MRPRASDSHNASLRWPLGGLTRRIARPVQSWRPRRQIVSSTKLLRPKFQLRVKDVLLERTRV